MHIKENIKRRKAIALETMKKYNHIYKSHKLSIKTKTRHFNTYIESIVLYHSEIWTTSNHHGINRRLSTTPPEICHKHGIPQDGVIRKTSKAGQTHTMEPENSQKTNDLARTPLPPPRGNACKAGLPRSHKTPHKKNRPPSHLLDKTGRNRPSHSRSPHKILVLRTNIFF